MKELILKFLSTQKIETILTELVALFSLYIGFRKYLDKKRRENTAIYKVTIAEAKINTILEKLSEKIKSRNTVCSVIEITNGGGTPKLNRPKYVKAIHSPNAQIIKLWGQNKVMITPQLNKCFAEMMQTEKSYINVEHFKIDKVEGWAKAMDISTVFYYLIGNDGNNITLALVVNSESKFDFSDSETLDIITAASDIKKIINDNRKWCWRRKVV